MLSHYGECTRAALQQLDLRGMKIVIDAGHGATYQVGPAVFRELGAEVISMCTHPDGVNINENAGATSPEGMAARVRETGADLGIAFDGDGDRVIMVDDQGEIVDGDQLLFIIAMDRHSRGILKGGVVGTLMTNLGMEKALEAAGIPFARANVGDRYVNELLIANDWQLGGESSGHIICRDASTAGDGDCLGVQNVKAMQTAGKSLSEVVECDHTLSPQVMINVRVQDKRDHYSGYY